MGRAPCWPAEPVTRSVSEAKDREFLDFSLFRRERQRRAVRVTVFRHVLSRPRLGRAFAAEASGFPAFQILRCPVERGETALTRRVTDGGFCRSARALPVDDSG